MDQWYAIEFNPATARWSRGKSPFGQYMGKLPTRPIHKCNVGCTGPGCYGATPINTLWDKEVLLMRGTFKTPPIQDGHRLRLRVNDGNHVGSGGGHIVYINGKLLYEAKTCNGRGSGGLPKGAYITNEFLDDFRSGEVTIAVMTFLRFNDKYKVKPSSSVPQGKISVHLEQQKLPHMGDDLVRKSATVVAMRSSLWQSAQDPADRERQASAVKFQYGGQHTPNPRLVGQWRTLGTVKTIDEFTPDRRLSPRRAKITGINFMNGGATDGATRIWSGDTLMDLTRYEALKMKIKTINDEDYLFIEAGGFNAKHGAGWKSPWYVLKR